MDLQSLEATTLSDLVISSTNLVYQRRNSREENKKKILDVLQGGMKFLLEGMIQIETEIGLSGVIGIRLHQEEKKGHTGGANHLPGELIDKVNHLMRTRK